MTDLSMTGGSLRPVNLLEHVKSAAYRLFPGGEYQTPNWLGNSQYARSSQATVRRTDIAKREAIDLIATESIDASVLPGTLATEAVFAESKQRDELTKLVHVLHVQGYSNQAGRSLKISTSTMKSALSLISSLPYGTRLPKMSPDGEGGLIFVWDDPNRTLLVVLDDSMIHLVSQPGTQHAQYQEDIYFDQERLPPELLAAIPA